MFATRHALRRHLIVVLIIKTALLYGLWAMFFSNPPAMTGDEVGKVIAGEVGPAERER